MISNYFYYDAPLLKVSFDSEKAENAASFHKQAPRE